MSRAKNRNYCLDFIRVISFVWIVLVWHLNNHAAFFNVGLFSIAFTKVALAAFFFISGILVTTKYQFDSSSETFRFYKKRLLRIYPLYTVAILTFPVVISFKPDVMLKAFLGISSYVPPQIYTLWFISMLVSFYAITPFLCGRNSNKRLWILSACLFMALFMYYWRYSLIDFRFFVYFPFYVFGLVLGKRNRNGFELADMNISNTLCFLRKHRGIASFGVLALLVLVGIGIEYRARLSMVMSYAVRNKTAFLPFEYMGISAGLFLFILVGNWKVLERLRKVVDVLAYASFAAYLFHRQIYTGLTVLTNSLGGTPQMKTAIFLLIGIPLTVTVSYYIQYTYDKFVAFGASRSATPNKNEK